MTGVGGLVGYTPQEDLPSLLAVGDGSYHRLRRRFAGPPPAALADAQAVYLCFHGEWEDLGDLEDHAHRVLGVLPEGGAVITTAIVPAHPPTILVTTFA